MNREELLKKIIVEAGKETLKFYKKKTLKKKSKTYEGDFVTEADIRSHNVLAQAIKKYFPKDGIISEEDKDYNVNSEYLWIMDPIDGTYNFASGIPIFGVMVAIAKNKKVVSGGVYFPVLNEFYFAEKGKGATLNGKKILCSKKKDLFNARTAGYMEPGSKFKKEMIDLFLLKEKYSYWHTEFGSGAYDTMLTATGANHGFIAPPAGYGGVWDLAAPQIILKEAGCKVTDCYGKEWSISKDGNGFIAANPVLHKELMKIISKK
ncbi:MAG: inositol monophosphatase family protein [Candidatus Nanoarchaeia archaeon]